MKKYFVYKISGGLCHMLNHINNAINLSKISNRYLIIDTYCYTFCNDFNKYFSIPKLEYSTNYQEIVENNELNQKYKDYIKSNVGFHPSNDYRLLDKSALLNTDDVINSEEDVIFFTYLKNNTADKELFNLCHSSWNIKLKKEILDEIQKIGKIEEDYIGFHFRNTDMKSNLTDLAKEVNKYTDKIKTLYLATDDVFALEELKKLIPDDIKIIQFTKPFDAGGKGIHYGNPNKNEVIMTSLTDLYYLSKSTFFVGSPRSSFSAKVNSIRDGSHDLF